MTTFTAGSRPSHNHPLAHNDTVIFQVGHAILIYTVRGSTSPRMWLFRPSPSGDSPCGNAAIFHELGIHPSDAFMDATGRVRWDGSTPPPDPHNWPETPNSTNGLWLQTQLVNHLYDLIEQSNQIDDRLKPMATGEVF